MVTFYTSEIMKYVGGREVSFLLYFLTIFPLNDWSKSSKLIRGKILGHAFHTWLSNDYAMIFSHVSTVSTYKRPPTLHYKRVIAFSLFEP